MVSKGFIYPRAGSNKIITVLEGNSLQGLETCCACKGMDFSEVFINDLSS